MTSSSVHLKKKKKKAFNFEQEEEVAGVVSESDSEDELKEEEAWTAVRTRNKCDPESVPALQTTENKSDRELPRGASEEVGQRGRRQTYYVITSFKIKATVTLGS